MRNLEIKLGLTAGDRVELERQVRAAGIPVTVLEQVDTYFVTTHGRLKLRQITNEYGEHTAELIFYSRPDRSGPRWSNYDVLPLTPEVAKRLGTILAASIGTVATVTKRRVVAIRERSRIHLDQVAGLGSFLEIETVVTDDEEAGIDRELRATLEWLGLDLATADPIHGSYADLMREQATRG